MKDPLGLGEFKIPVGRLAPRQEFVTRGGERLSYRFYPAWSENLIFLYHGIGADSRYLCVLAAHWAEQGLGSVVTPDLRGHGGSRNLSDEIRPGQLEMDHEELWVHLRQSHVCERVFLAGHSLGGGFVLRLLAEPGNYAGALALAPYLPPSSGLQREGYGGWISFDQKGDVDVHMPEIFRTGEERLHYGAAYLQAASPFEDPSLLRREVPLWVVCGDQDQVFQPERYANFFAAQKQVSVEILPRANHFSLVIALPLVKRLTESLKEKFNFFT